jgi:hypothetical protein
MLAMWMSTCINIPHVPKNSISLSIPSQNALSKILTQKAFPKNGESGLAMWKNNMF